MYSLLARPLYRNSLVTTHRVHDISPTSYAVVTPLAHIMHLAKADRTGICAIGAMYSTSQKNAP